MSERKVLNKYYPPDFDPSKIPRLRLPRNRQYTVRIMAPTNMRCNTCGDYIARGKKFNARKETVDHEEYLGLKVFRFYFKCPRCMQEITFKTDPKNYDYVVEHGATPNFKALKLAHQQEVEQQKEKEEEERLNPMKLLENRTKASRREMENLEALEDLKEMNQREVVVDYNDLLKKKKDEFEAEMKRQEEEDEALVQSMFGNKKQLDSINEDEEDGDYDEEVVEEIEDLSDLYPSLPKSAFRKDIDKESNDGEASTDAKSTANCTDLLSDETASSSSGSSSLQKASSSTTATTTANSHNKRKLLKDMIVVKRRPAEVVEIKVAAVSKPAERPTGALSSLCSYSDSDSE